MLDAVRDTLMLLLNEGERERLVDDDDVHVGEPVRVAVREAPDKVSDVVADAEFESVAVDVALPEARLRVTWCVGVTTPLVVCDVVTEAVAVQEPLTLCDRVAESSAALGVTTADNVGIRLLDVVTVGERDDVGDKEQERLALDVALAVGVLGKLDVDVTLIVCSSDFVAVNVVVRVACNVLEMLRVAPVFVKVTVSVGKRERVMDTRGVMVRALAVALRAVSVGKRVRVGVNCKDNVNGERDVVTATVPLRLITLVTVSGIDRVALGVSVLVTSHTRPWYAARQ